CLRCLTVFRGCGVQAVTDAGMQVFDHQKPAKNLCEESMKRFFWRSAVFCGQFVTCAPGDAQQTLGSSKGHVRPSATPDPPRGPGARERRTCPEFPQLPPISTQNRSAVFIANLL